MRKTIPQRNPVSSHKTKEKILGTGIEVKFKQSTVLVGLEQSRAVYAGVHSKHRPSFFRKYKVKIDVDAVSRNPLSKAAHLGYKSRLLLHDKMTDSPSKGGIFYSC